MFGSTAFMVDGKMCISAGSKGLMCRIDPEVHDEAVKRPGCATVVMRGRKLRGYVRVATAALTTKKELQHWVTLALDYNPRVPRKRATKG